MFWSDTAFLSVICTRNVQSFQGTCQSVEDAVLVLASLIGLPYRLTVLCADSAMLLHLGVYY